MFKVFKDLFKGELLDNNLIFEEILIKWVSHKKLLAKKKKKKNV